MSFHEGLISMELKFVSLKRSVQKVFVSLSVTFKRFLTFFLFQVIVPMSLLLTPKILRNLVSKQLTLLRGFRIMVRTFDDYFDEQIDPRKNETIFHVQNTNLRGTNNTGKHYACCVLKRGSDKKRGKISNGCQVEKEFTEGAVIGQR